MSKVRYFAAYNFALALIRLGIKPRNQYATTYYGLVNDKQDL